jgi:hypothetical protein
MTLVVSLGNSDQIVQISDRQLTDGRGKPFVVPENKATILTLANSRLLVGFAGLARAARFRTAQWMLEALSAAAADDHLAHGTVERFTEVATERFQKPDLKAVPRERRGLTDIFTGYNDTIPPPCLISAVVTNFQNFESGCDEEPWDHFKATYWSILPGVPPEEATYIQRIGTWIAVDDERDVNQLRHILEERRSPEVIIEASVGKVREIAARASARGLIGKDLSTAVLPAPRPAGLGAGEYPISSGFTRPEPATCCTGQIR